MNRPLFFILFYYCLVLFLFYYNYYFVFIVLYNFVCYSIKILLILKKCLESDMENLDIDTKNFSSNESENTVLEHTIFMLDEVKHQEIPEYFNSEFLFICTIYLALFC